MISKFLDVFVVAHNDTLIEFASHFMSSFHMLIPKRHGPTATSKHGVSCPTGYKVAGND